MKRVLFFLILLLGCRFVSAQPIKKMKMDQLVKMIDTTTVPLVVNFWATWCAPCVHEIPWFEKNIGAFKNEKVKLVLVSLDFADEYPKNIAAFAKKNGYHAEIIWLDETDTDSFCPKIDQKWEGTIPVSLMVNNKKHYRRFYNQQLPEAKLVQELKQLVE
jgi:thiol-disulfide isomerase/thioredoxin